MSDEEYFEFETDVFDNEQLILAVQNRPALYNKQLKEYGDRNVKEKLWEEVCASIIKNWDKLNCQEKIQKGKDVQKKWKNLKDCFSRELAKQKNLVSGQAAKKRKKYLFFDAMLFLVPTLEERETTSNVEEHYEETERVIQPKANVGKNKQKKQTISYEKSLLNILETKSKEPLDEEKNFALMLVPMLKKLNEDQKHFAKIEILNVMKMAKSYTSGPPIQQLNPTVQQHFGHLNPPFPSTSSVGQHQFPATSFVGHNPYYRGPTYYQSRPIENIQFPGPSINTSSPSPAESSGNDENIFIG